MTSQPQQLIPLDEITRALGYGHVPSVVTNRVGEHVVPFWDGRDALPFDIAAQVVEEFRAKAEAARKKDADAEAAMQRDIQERVDEARRRAEEKNARPRRIPWGRDVSTPDSPRWWAESEAG